MLLEYSESQFWGNWLRIEFAVSILRIMPDKYCQPKFGKSLSPGTFANITGGDGIQIFAFHGFPYIPFLREGRVKVFHSL